MSGITLEQAQAKLDAWMAADDAVSTGQEYAMGSRRLTRADAAVIRENITFWEKKVIALANRGPRIWGGTPC